MEVIIVSFLDAVVTVDVLATSNTDIKLVESLTLYILLDLHLRLVLKESTNFTAITRIRIENFITCLLPEMPREISFIPSILRRVSAAAAMAGIE